MIGPPVHELPVAVALDAVLARTGEVAVVVTVAQVHGTGMHLDVAMVARTGDVPERDRFLLGPAAGAEAHLEVRFADGRRATLDEPVPGDGEVVLMGAGGGSPSGSHVRLWLAPLPPEGALTFVLDWPAEGIAGATVAVDAAPLRAAAAQATTLWEDPRPPRSTPPSGDPGWLGYAP